MVENLSPDPYFKNQDLAYLCISSLKIHIVFHCMPKSRTTKTMKLRCCPLGFPLCKAFLKQKRSETSLPASKIFEGKNFSCCILFTDHILLSDCNYLMRYCTMCIL